jgi:formiminoglutamate deiminase
VTTYWAAYAWLPTGVRSSVRLRIRDGQFADVRSGEPPSPGDERIDGLVLPGLANGHSHAFHRALRGRTHAGTGTFWTWRTQMYEVARWLDPDSYRQLARAVYAEMALAGYTAVGEFHYLHHDLGGRRYADPNAMGHALIEAAGEAGIRLTLLDTCYLAGGLGADGHLPLDEVQRRFSDGDADAWAERAQDLRPTERVKIGVAAHSVRSVPRESLAAVVRAAGGRPLHVHLSEQPAENLATAAFYGRSPAEVLEDAGVLGPETTAVHATHVSDIDIVRLGSTSTRACVCPTTERDLADGVGPARRLLDAGSPLSLGSDQHGVIDPFEEMRGLEMHERLASHERGRFTPAQLLDAGAAAGYKSLGWPGGRIEEGAPADFVTVRTDSVRTGGCEPSQAIYAANAADVDRVVVGGTTVVSEGQHALGDVGHLLSTAIRAVDRP